MGAVEHEGVEVEVGEHALGGFGAVDDDPLAEQAEPFAEERFEGRAVVRCEGGQHRVDPLGEREEQGAAVDFAPGRAGERAGNRLQIRREAHAVAVDADTDQVGVGAADAGVDQHAAEFAPVEEEVVRPLDAQWPAGERFAGLQHRDRQRGGQGQRHRQRLGHAERDREIAPRFVVPFSLLPATPPGLVVCPHDGVADVGIGGRKVLCRNARRHVHQSAEARAFPQQGLDSGVFGHPGGVVGKARHHRRLKFESTTADGVEALDGVVRAGKGMNQSGEHLPAGFLGPVRGWSSLVPQATHTLQLPRDRQVLRSSAAAGPEPRYDLVEVQALTESLGRIEDALPELARRLADGGTFLLDVDNLQSPRMLRLVVEGRPGSFEPAGSTDDPSQFLPLRRVLNAFAAAGLAVVDVLRVPATAAEFGASFAGEIMAHGLLPLDWLDGPPPSRFWIVAKKQRSLAGSVVVAGGDAAARERTAADVRAFLPDDWEVVVGEGIRETTQWNRGIAVARGDLVWFLRGGSRPTRELFDALTIAAGVGGTAPGVENERQHAGDVVGIMLPRNDLLFTGPFPERIANTQVAMEEYAMRLDSRLPPLQVVEASLEAPRPAVDEPAKFAAEAQALVQRWTPIGKSALAPAVVPAKPDATTPAAPWDGRKPRVSLCMIARNETRFLGKCLALAQPAVDEIVLVDTGSTDDTVAIAESFGAKVLHSPWQDDFSAPRNVALAAASGDWILVLDADEFLQPGACERIRALVENPAVSGYHLHFVNVYGKGRTLGVMMVRLFRNLPGLAYEGIIHEQVTPSLQRLGAERGLVLCSTDVEVEHHGYTDEIMDLRGKNARNERLFDKQLAQHPDDVYAHYKFGDFLRRVPGRSADARRLLDRCLELILAGPPSLPRELPYAGEVAALCALEAARAGDNDRARAVLDLALRRFLPTPNLHYLAASLALAEGRAEDAMLHYRRCLSYRGQVLVVPIQEGITSYVSLAGIAQAWMLRGDHERARRLLEQAITMEPSYEVGYLALSRLWLHLGDNSAALRVLTNFLATHPDSPGACQQTTLILQRLGKTTEARRMGKHALQLLQSRSLDHEAAAMNKILATI